MLTRAVSCLEIKSVDAVTRTITGLATTPTADRSGDIVEPKGAEFNLPIPLLWQHDPERPIGEVFAAKVTAGGIEIKARIASVDTPGLLRDRLDLAWQSIQAKLVKGLSIGFRSVEHARMDTGGYHFLKWKWFELSAVTIPANGDATIQTIKSIDAANLAAIGNGSAGVSASVPAGDSAQLRTAKPGRDPMPKTTQEQIESFNAARVAKSAAMVEIMTKAGDSGETLDPADSEQYDTLEAEVSAIDKHLSRLDALQKSQTMRPVTATAPAMVGGGQPAGQPARVSVQPNMPAGIEFARAILCQAKSLLKSNSVSPIEYAKALYPDNSRIQTFLKGAVPAATTSDAVWAGPLVDQTNLASEFLEYLRPETIIGKFGTNGIPSLRRVPFNVRITGQTGGGTGYWVGQGAAKPLTSFAFNAQTLLWAKVAAISVLTEESIRFSSPSVEMLVRDGLRDALVERLDIDFIDPTQAAVASISPASITYGLTALTPSGTTADAARSDVARILKAYLDLNQNVAGLVLIMPNALALSLSMMRNSLGQKEFPDLTMGGGFLEGIPVITSQYAANASGAGNLLIAVNTRYILLADDGQVSVEASREASLQMADNPTNNSATANGQSMVSMFQTNSVALKAERFINWSVARTGAVVYMDDVNWGTIGSPA